MIGKTLSITGSIQEEMTQKNKRAQDHKTMNHAWKFPVSPFKFSIKASHELVISNV